MYIEHIDNQNVRISLTPPQLFQILQMLEHEHKEGRGNESSQYMVEQMREYFAKYGG